MLPRLQAPVEASRPQTSSSTKATKDEMVPLSAPASDIAPARCRNQRSMRPASGPGTCRESAASPRGVQQQPAVAEAIPSWQAGPAPAVGVRLHGDRVRRACWSESMSGIVGGGSRRVVRRWTTGQIAAFPPPLLPNWIIFSHGAPFLVLGFGHGIRVRNSVSSALVRALSNSTRGIIPVRPMMTDMGSPGWLNCPVTVMIAFSRSASLLDTLSSSSRLSSTKALGLGVPAGPSALDHRREVVLDRACRVIRALVEHEAADGYGGTRDPPAVFEH